MASLFSYFSSWTRRRSQDPEPSPDDFQAVSSASDTPLEGQWVLVPDEARLVQSDCSFEPTLISAGLDRSVFLQQSVMNTSNSPYLPATVASAVATPTSTRAVESVASVPDLADPENGPEHFADRTVERPVDVAAVERPQLGLRLTLGEEVALSGDLRYLRCADRVEKRKQQKLTNSPKTQQVHTANKRQNQQFVRARQSKRRAKGLPRR